MKQITNHKSHTTFNKSKYIVPRQKVSLLMSELHFKPRSTNSIKASKRCFFKPKEVQHNTSIFNNCRKNKTHLHSLNLTNRPSKIAPFVPGNVVFQLLTFCGPLKEIPASSKWPELITQYEGHLNLEKRSLKQPKNGHGLNHLAKDFQYTKRFPDFHLASVVWVVSPLRHQLRGLVNGGCGKRKPRKFTGNPWLKHH